jgi:hypothetical protein
VTKRQLPHLALSVSSGYDYCVGLYVLRRDHRLPLPGDSIANFGKNLNAMDVALSPQYTDRHPSALLGGELASCLAVLSLMLPVTCGCCVSPTAALRYSGLSFAFGIVDT